jgi:hypothetical protein
MIVRAALLGVLLYTVASLQHARGLEFESSAPAAYRSSTSALASFNRVASVQSACVGIGMGMGADITGADHDCGLPFSSSGESQDGGGSIEGGDDLDDFEDIVSHPHAYLDGQLWSGLTTHVATEHARACARLEDRRFEKPPRA